MIAIVLLVGILQLCSALPAEVQQPVPARNVNLLHNGLSNRIGNFSIEALYYTGLTLPEGQNFIMSPITVWNVLAIMGEGAAGDTRVQIRKAIRWSKNQTVAIRNGFKEITQLLKVYTDTVKLAKINTMFVDKTKLPEKDFRELAKRDYETEVIPLDFADSVNAANTINAVVANGTHGLIKKIVDADYFQSAALVLSSALYFKGQWTVPFNASSTVRLPFYDSNGKKTGEVNMMYNRYTYPFSNFKDLQARVIELPYGKENRLSMLIMLPNPGVSVEDMFKNFQKVNLDTFFEELRVSKEEYSEDEVDCLIPRFKIESNLDLSAVLKNQFNITQMFDPSKAFFPDIARTPLYVSKIVHKAEIEVTEEGTTAAGVTVAEFSNRIGVVQFQANRPFTYIIVEKLTNSIVFGGFYKQPSLY